MRVFAEGDVNLLVFRVRFIRLNQHTTVINVVVVAGIRLGAIFLFHVRIALDEFHVPKIIPRDQEQVVLVIIKPLAV